CYAIIGKSKRPIRVHVFGMSSARILRFFPIQQCDASSWWISPGCALIPVPVMVGQNRWDFSLPPDRVAVTDKTRHRPDHLHHLSPSKFEQAMAWIEERRTDLDLISRSLTARRKCWLDYYLQVQEQFSVTLFFVTQPNDVQQASVLTAAGADHRLMSYFKL